MEIYRIHDESSVYFVTFSVVEWLPVFISSDACRIVTESLTHCHLHNGLRIDAYVIMPTHMHAIVFDAEFDPDRLSCSLDAFRKFTGRALADHAATHLPPCFSAVFRDNAGPDRKRRFWQPTRHPVSLKSSQWRKQKRNYLHANPCRKGLVMYPEDWRFSSARFYLELKDEHADVEITPLEG